MKNMFRRWWFAGLLLGYFACFVSPGIALADPRPPVAKTIPQTTEVHGEQRIDNYFWFREKTNSAVLAYLKAENAYTKAMMKPTEKFQKSLFNEMIARIKETETAVPYRKGDYFYYTRIDKGQQYPVYCRKHGSLEAPEVVMLDLNKLARGQKFLGVGASTVSDDGNLLAYSLDNTGFRDYTLYVKDLRTGKNGPEKIAKTGTVAWAADNHTLFYTIEDDAKREYRLYRHHLGESKDELVYEEKDEKFDLVVDRTRSETYLMLSSDSKTTSEVRYLAANQPEGSWKVILPREPGHEYDVDHRGNLFYIRSNKAGRNFRLVSAPVNDPRPENWQEIIPHRNDVMLTGTDFFADFYVITERANGLPRLTVINFATGDKDVIELPEPAYDLSPAENLDWNTKKYRFNYQSLVTAESVYDYDVEKHSSQLLKRRVVLGGYDPANYVSERILATAQDGTKIPISLVYRKGTKRDGSAPLLLDGYGAYGIPNDVDFSSTRLSLLDRGFVFAIAHIRGGGELGKLWHEQGRLMNKKNTFTDFISAAEFLIAEKYTGKEHLIIEGASAGGMLMGAVTNMRPDLFKAVLTQVPFVDVINTMLDETLPLTVGEFEEWGNPKNKADYDYMKSYCPYTNVRAQNYPNLLVETSLNDSQVMYWEPTKYVAKLRALKTDHNLLLLKVNLNAGHGGASGRYDYLHEVAFNYAFMLNQVGITH